MQKSYEQHNLWELCKIFYSVLLGNYEDYLQIDPYTLLNPDLSFFIIVGVSIIMVILMLNMLIALISESHGDVMKLEKQAERYEKLHLMIDSQLTINWVSFIFPCLFRRDSQRDNPKVSTTLHNQDTPEQGKRRYCSFVRYEENISIEEAERALNKKKIDDISTNIEKLLRNESK